MEGDEFLPDDDAPVADIAKRLNGESGGETWIRGGVAQRPATRRACPTAAEGCIPGGLLATS
ncbi:hypothetical protein [Streptomyces sp. NK15101]|uniref:hypothetical protein n=1 Tax=Streptomyces sp. NK15101 TaxID=2873261 RepID=UPI001CED239F|nr:hypothetical protein [Streptomyces sp. NK15101]